MGKYAEILNSLKLRADAPDFLAKIFTYQSRILKSQADDLRRLCCEEYDDLSKRVDRSLVQESVSVRNVLRTRKIAIELILDSGEINFELLDKLILRLQERFVSLGQDRQFDTLRNQHLLKALLQLQGSKSIQRIIKGITKPYSHKIAEQVIRETLQLPPHTAITDADTRRAVLSAWFCYLRQNVGSCFATAPAILVQNEQPEIFLSDLNEILSIGRLKRTFEGVEYTVPMSPTWGAGDLKRVVPPDLSEIGFSPALLAAFEAVKIVDNALPLKERIQHVQDLLRKVKVGNFTSADEIIQKVLMHQLKITEHDYTEYLRRKEVSSFNQLMHVAQTTGFKQTESCSTYEMQLPLARSTFKAYSDNALLKTWEFTVASFSETKAQFTRWNLYSSLGLNTQDPGSLGGVLYEIISSKLAIANQKVQDYQAEYEVIYGNLKYLEARMRSASTEKEVQWMRAEYQSKANEFYTFEEIRNKEHHRAQRLAGLYNDIVKFYDDNFPLYFQEVYDAEMQGVTTGPFDDSPAGYRLLYKHGRANTSQWTLIYTPQEFVQSLASFFIATETELIHTSDFEGLETDLSDIVTAVVNYVKTEEFLISSFQRMAVTHKTRLIKDPLENLDKIPTKPWAYISGGTMQTLIMCYFFLNEKPHESSRWVENPMELLTFLVDTVKSMPAYLQESFEHDPSKRVLMYSPTHAFNLLPGSEKFKEAWSKETFTYTALRDEYLRPMERFVEYQFLDEEMYHALIEILLREVPESLRVHLKEVLKEFPGKLNPPELKKHLMEIFRGQNGESIDALLYSALPLFSSYELRNRIEKIFEIVDEPHLKMYEAAAADVAFSIPSHTYISAKQFQDICKAVYVLVHEKTTSAVDVPLKISQAAQKLGYAHPMPLIFADTNWTKYYFGFLVNPGTGKFDLWRVDYTGTVGAPMTVWKEYLDGSRKDIPWGVYNHPRQYKK